MAAFDRISCGIPQLDTVFDNIRLGDNVVWQLSSLEDFPTFVEPFVAQCLADKRPIIYMRFASHEPLVKPQPGVTIYELNPHKGFEAFTIEVRELITKEGREACYVFDCLSELQAAWSADLMMGNFFRRSFVSNHCENSRYHSSSNRRVFFTRKRSVCSPSQDVEPL